MSQPGISVNWRKIGLPVRPDSALAARNDVSHLTVPISSGAREEAAATPTARQHVTGARPFCISACPARRSSTSVAGRVGTARVPNVANDPPSQSPAHPFAPKMSQDSGAADSIQGSSACRLARPARCGAGARVPAAGGVSLAASLCGTACVTVAAFDGGAGAQPPCRAIVEVARQPSKGRAWNDARESVHGGWPMTALPVRGLVGQRQRARER